MQKKKNPEFWRKGQQKVSFPQGRGEGQYRGGTKRVNTLKNRKRATQKDKERVTTNITADSKKRAEPRLRDTIALISKKGEEGQKKARVQTNEKTKNVPRWRSYTGLFSRKTLPTRMKGGLESRKLGARTKDEPTRKKKKKKKPKIKTGSLPNEGKSRSKTANVHRAADMQREHS